MDKKDILEDCFPERKEFIKEITNLIKDLKLEKTENEDFQNVILIYSLFGHGKTFFAKKLNEYLDLENLSCIYLNIWEADYNSNPLLPIIEKMLKYDRYKYFNRFKKAKNGVENFLKDNILTNFLVKVLSNDITFSYK